MIYAIRIQIVRSDIRPSLIQAQWVVCCAWQVESTLQRPSETIQSTPTADNTLYSILNREMQQSLVTRWILASAKPTACMYKIHYTHHLITGNYTQNFFGQKYGTGRIVSKYNKREASLAHWALINIVYLKCGAMWQLSFLENVCWLSVTGHLCLSEYMYCSSS